jgi:hypothetical protein
MWSILAIILFTLMSGYADVQGFTHASKMWDGGKLIWREAGWSALGFVSGFTTYWLAVRFLKETGVVATEIQTILWFSVTIIGIALVSRKFFQWQRIDQVIAVIVLIGIGWLLFRTE